MKLYIAGKIGGQDQKQSFEQFRNAQKALEIQGYETLNPWDVPACADSSCAPQGPEEHTWSCYLKYDIAAFLATCQGIALLPNWQDSPGARLEQYVAVSCGLEIRPVADWLRG